MKRIFVCSPLRPQPPRSYEQNISLAERLCRVVVEQGHAPFAPHAFYTRFLDDTRDDHRTSGMEAGRAWLLEADEVWVYDRLGVSEGMKAEINLARLRSIPVFYAHTMYGSLFAEVAP